MAYAPGSRFLHADRAFYVLKDWVETNTDKRARILRNRIVTPFDDKNTEFSEDVLDSAIRDDMLYANFGIVVSSTIAKVVANRLPDRPIELYFLQVIQKRMEVALAQRMVPIGRSAFVTIDRAIERNEVESMDSWRRRLLLDILGCRSEDLLDSMERYGEPISTRLKELVPS